MSRIIVATLYIHNYYTDWYNAEIPSITSTFPDEREHYTGEQNLTYACESDGFPLPRIAFYFNGASITVDNSMDIIVNNDTLIIPSPQVSHSGLYQCIVSNEFGDDQQSWLLEIIEPGNNIIIIV